MLTASQFGIQLPYNQYQIQDTLNLLCACGKDIESKPHFFLHCTYSHIPTQTSFRVLEILINRFYFRLKRSSQILAYDNLNYNLTINMLIINSTVEYLIWTEKFKCSLLIKMSFNKTKSKYNLLKVINFLLWLHCLLPYPSS